MKSTTSSAGTLYLVPVSIASPSEWSFDQEIEDALKTCGIIVCERTRTARRMIKYLFDQNAFDQLEFIEMDKHKADAHVTETIRHLSAGTNVVIMSEAGMPCIADPGHELVLAAQRLNMKIHPFPGPSSFMMALMASGLNGQAFTFHGYLPRDQDKLNPALRSIDKSLQRDTKSHIFMETPYRNQKLFNSVLKMTSEDVYFNISMDINGPNEMIKTKTIYNWKKKPYSFDEKYPAVFILGKK